jgi:hypothetical protein
MRRVCGRSCCIINTCGTRLCLKYKQSLPTLIFGKVSCVLKRSSIIGVLSKIGMVKVIDFWKTFCMAIRHYPISIHHYIILYNRDSFVANILSHVPLNIGFRRSLTGNTWNSGLHFYFFLTNAVGEAPTITLVLEIDVGTIVSRDG